MKNIKEIRADFGSAFAEASTIPGLTITDNIEIAIALLREYGKYQRGEAMSTAKANGNSSQPATDKQKIALGKFGVKFSDNITKSEASEWLDKLITEAKKKGGYPAPSFSY